MTQTTPILIKTTATDKPSPAQKKFNTTMKRIDKQKQLLAQWQESLPRYRQELIETMQPLKAAFTAQQEQLMLRLDEAYKTQKLTKIQQDKISYIITSISEQLIEIYERDDLKPYYNFYANADYDQEEEEAKAAYYAQVKESIKEDLGLEIDPENMNPETFAEIRERINAKQEEAFAAEEAKRSKRKKTAKQLAKEEREQQEAQALSQSIQSIYRQLVGALHPDREPDETERLRKTELMQQVTVAYDNKDLLKLLELQLAIEQIDQAHINNLNEERLKYFNKILQDQLYELEQEVFVYQQEAYELTQGMGILFGTQPSDMPRLINRQVESFKKQLANLKLNVEAVQELRSLKAWLNEYKIPRPMQYIEIDF
ncbi:hypothetical protein [Thiofilum flexile]|uniref:hypothetical protein n=1 Tax=Thiofilum flexile TaxID=125627 RepID=UPI00037891E3|nr:hypothetical protein [Thiofilum flexile]